MVFHPNPRELGDHGRHVLIRHINVRVLFVNINRAHNACRQTRDSRDFAHEIRWRHQMLTPNIKGHRRETGFVARARFALIRALLGRKFIARLRGGRQRLPLDPADRGRGRRGSAAHDRSRGGRTGRRCGGIIFIGRHALGFGLRRWLHRFSGITLRQMDQRGGNIRARVTLLQQPINHLIVRAEFLGIQRRLQLLEKYITLGLLHFVQ